MVCRKINYASRSLDPIYPNATSYLFIAWSGKRRTSLFFVQKTAMYNIHFLDDYACNTELRPVLFKPDSEDSVRNAWTDVARHSYPDREVIDDEAVLWKFPREPMAGARMVGQIWIRRNQQRWSFDVSANTENLLPMLLPLVTLSPCSNTIVLPGSSWRSNRPAKITTAAKWK